MDALVLFDIDRVLVDIDTERMHAYLSRHARLAPDEIRERLNGTRHYDAIDIGDKERYYAIVRGALGARLPGAVLDQAHLRVIVGPNTEVVRLKERVTAQVGLLSDISTDALAHIRERWPGTLYSNGPSAFSHMVGALKPQPAIYDTITGTARTVFIDDTPDNLVYPVTRLGWTGIRYAERLPYAPVPPALINHRNYREARDARELADHLRDLRMLR